MTPKEKANQIAKRFFDEQNLYKRIAIQCAIITVEEIIATDTLINDDIYLDTPSYLEFWKQVKKELENL